MDVKLVMFTNEARQKSFTLPSRVTVIGRRRQCDLYIPLGVISRRHCQINLDGDSLNIRDLGSSNGTFVNRKKIGYEEQQLKPGDRIQVGPLTFTVQIDGVPAEITPPPADDLISPEKPDDVGPDDFDLSDLSQGDTVLE